MKPILQLQYDETANRRSLVYGEDEIDFDGLELRINEEGAELVFSSGTAEITTVKAKEVYLIMKEFVKEEGDGSTGTVEDKTQGDYGMDS